MPDPTPGFVGPLIQIGDPSNGAVLIPGAAAGGNDIILQTRGANRTYDLSVVPNSETQWKYSSNVTMADPLTGNFRANNASAVSVTQLAFARVSAQGVDRGQLFHSLEPGDTVYIQDLDNTANWARFSVASVPTDNTTWFLVPVAFVGSSGTGIGNNNRCLITFSQTGTGGVGPPGSGDLSYVFTQVAPSANWSVTHGLGKFPAVSVVDSGNSVIIPDVHYNDSNSVTLSFGSATSGKAYLN